MIILNEMKFYPDGPDLFAYYWHDLRKEPEVFFSRQQGGKSLYSELFSFAESEVVCTFLFAA